MFDEYENKATDTNDPSPLVNRLGYLTESQVLLVTGIRSTTAAAWRKRGDGPPYALVGNHYVYPLEPFRDWIESNIRNNARDHRVGSLL